MPKYHYFYRITNLINGKYYYGVHSTNNLNDNYMGSGVRLKMAYKKYGIENFEKKIIKYFNTRQECLNYEASVVNEYLVSDEDCYNIALGGCGSITPPNMVTAKDKDGNTIWISKLDERWSTGEVVGVTKGYTNCFDLETQTYVQVTNNEFLNDDRYIGLTTSKVPCKMLGSDTYMMVDVNEFREKRNMYITSTQNKVVCKDNSGKYYALDREEAYERISRGELHHIWVGRTHTLDTRQKMCESHKKNGDQRGKKNSQYGTRWVTKDGVNKKIHSNELDEYICKGWSKGRKINKKEG